jgi:hypothetical protein
MMARALMALLCVANVAHGNDFARSIRQSEQVTKGLVAYWAMRNSGTTVYDELGVRNATAVDGVSFSSGVVGNGANCDGNNDYINTSYKPPNTFSLSMWRKVKESSAGGAGLVSTYSGATYTGFNLTQWTGFVMYYDTLQNKTGPSAHKDVWKHFAVTSSGSIITVYEDGALFLQWSGTTTHAGNLFLGRSRYDNDFSYCSLDEVRIYNRAISADEVKQLYTMGKKILNNR